MACSSVFHASNPSPEYTFSWEIDNFHLTSLTVRGLAFKPVEEICLGFFLEVKFKKSSDAGHCLMLNLIPNGRVYLNLITRCQIEISNTQGNICCSGKKIYRIIKSTCLINYYCGAKSLSEVGLTDGKLKIAGTMTFSGYKLKTNTFPLPVEPQLPSVNHTELPKNLKTIYEGGLASEVVTFSIGDKKLAAHKAILCSQSPVFEKMFEHDMVENNTNKVNIEEAEFCTFNSFLVYLYTGVVKEGKEDKTYESTLSLYSVAKKYKVKSLQETCFLLLSEKMTVECVCDTLVLADLHKDKELKEAVKNFVGQNFFDIVGTIKWIEFVPTHPRLTQEVLDYVKGKSK